MLLRSSGLSIPLAELFHRSPVRRALTFLLDEKSKQKNQDAPNSLTARTVERRVCT